MRNLTQAEIQMISGGSILDPNVTLPGDEFCPMRPNIPIDPTCKPYPIKIDAPPPRDYDPTR